MKKRTIIKRIIYCTILFTLAVILGLFAYIQTDHGKAMLANAATDMLTSDEQAITINGISGTVPWNMSVDYLAIADSEGIWLELHDSVLDWNPLTIIRNVITINQASVQRIVMSRTPHSREDNTPEPPSDPQGLDDISVPDIVIGLISAPSITLPGSLTKSNDTLWSLRATGSGKNTIEGAIRRDNGDTALTYDISYSDARLHIDALFDEQAGGLIGTLASLPNEPLHADIQADGDLSSFNAAAMASIGDVKIINATATMNDNITVKAHGTIPLALAKLPAQDWTLSINATHDGNIWTLRENRATLGALTVDVDGTYNTVTTKFIDELSAIVTTNNALVSQGIAGNIVAKLGVSGTLEDTEITLNADAKSVQMSGTTMNALDADIAIDTSLSSWINTGISATTFNATTSATLNEAPLSLQSKGTVNADSLLIIDTIDATLPYQANASGTMRYHLTEQTIAGKLTVNNLALGKLAPGGPTGNVSATIAVDGTATRLPVSIDLRATSLAKLPDALTAMITDSATLKASLLYTPSALTLKETILRSGNMRAKAHATVPLSNTTKPADISLLLTHPSFDDITLETNIVRSTDKIALPDIMLTTKDNTLSGDVTYRTDSGIAKGLVTLDSDSISPLARWFAMPDAQGTAQGRVALNSINQQQSIDATLALNTISIPSRKLAIEQANIDVTTSNVANFSALLANATITNTRTNNAVIRTLTLSTSANDKGNITLQFDNDAVLSGTPILLSGNATYAATGATQYITLNALDGTYDNTTSLALQAPATVTLAANAFNVEPLLLTLGDGSLSAQATGKNNAINAGVTIKDLPLTPFIAPYVASTPDTILNSKIKISGRYAQPVVNGTTQLAMNTPGRDSADIIMSLDTVWDNTAQRPVIDNTLSLASSIDMGDASLTIPASLALAPFSTDIRQEAPLHGNANLRIPTGQLNLWTQPLGHKLAGIITGDIDIDGTISTPNAKGSIMMDDGQYDHTQFGVCLRNIDIEASFSNDHVVIDTISATGDSGRGTMAGNGRIDLANATIATQLTMDKLATFCQGLAQGKISGDIAANGTFSRMEIKGDLALDPIEVLIPGGGAQSIPSVDTIYRSELRAREANADNTDIILDINVGIPERMFVRGRGLEAEFFGDLAIQGTAVDPVIKGIIKTERGTMDVLGSTLRIQDGNIRFLNGNPAKPYIDMEATSVNNNVTITVNLIGPIAKPEINLSSVPSRPRDEILALLLFGRPVQDITPFQALQLAQAVSALSGKSSGPDVLGTARDTLGVDTLNINQDESGGTTLGAGKYVTDRVFVGVEQGTTPESSKVRTEIEILPNLKAETTAGSSEAPKIELEWRYDY